MQPGLAARELAHRLITGVLIGRHPLEQVAADLTNKPHFAALEARDRAFTRAVVAAVLRRLGELEHVLAAFVQRPLPQTSAARPILLAGAAQLVCLGMPPHAVVDLAVEAARRHHSSAKLAGLVNAVLRRVAAQGADLLQGVDPIAANVPAWMLELWGAAYGRETARQIAAASLREAALDISVKPLGTDAGLWAERLGGRLLPTGSIRVAGGGRVEELPGYAAGAWWVQDAAAALVTRIAGSVGERTAVDLCAAPGGKTAALAAAGTLVTAVDISPQRLERLAVNLRRLNFDAEVIAADATTWAPNRTFDIVMLDAPCTATGTIRRHPDILRLRRPADIARLASIQRALLANASRLVGPDGVLIYSTCSLEPEEGEQQVEAFLGINPAFRRLPIDAREINADPFWITAAGDLRTLPCHLPLDPPELSGLDGFYAARLTRRE
jgi:16S rRNA (cytosine967-C5)-methyltransferase